MALRDWTPAYVGRLWLIGSAIEAALFLGPSYYTRAAEARYRAESFPPHPVAADSGMRSIEARAESLGITIRRLPDSSVQILRHDSVMATLVAPAHGDSQARLQLSPTARAEAETAAKAIVGGLATSIGQGLAEAMPRIYLILALVYLPIPVGLIGVTLAWWFLRHGSSA